MAEIQPTRPRSAYFMAIRQLVGEGHDQFVDDAFTLARRPLRLRLAAEPRRRGRRSTCARDKIVWRVHVEGNRADHMAISPDGRRLLVSASTARKVHVIDTRSGQIVGNFESGDQPHENNFSRDGKLIYHASIGTVYSPLDDPLFDDTKGDRWFEVVDARTLRCSSGSTWATSSREYGLPNMSAAVRPMALCPTSATCTSSSRSCTASSSTTSGATARCGSPSSRSARRRRAPRARSTCSTRRTTGWR